MTESTILLVENHEDTREMFLAALEAEGFSVLAVSTAERAVEAARVIHAALVILDLGVRGDGLRVAEQLSALREAPRLIAVTDERRMANPTEAVFAAYLLKPVMPDDLVAAVRRVLGA